MIYILLIALVILFFLSYFFSGKDFLAPATIQILTFTGSVFLCIYFMFSINALHSFHWETIVMVISSMVLSMMIGAVGHWIYSKFEIKAHDRDSVEISPISNFMNVIVIGVIAFTIFWSLIEIRRIGGSSGNFNEIMHSYRMINSYSIDLDDKFPWVLRQFQSLLECLLIIYFFNMFRFFGNLSFYQKCTNICIICLCLVGLLLRGARTPVVNMIINAIVMFHLLRIQRDKGYKKYNFKVIVKTITVFIMIFVMFFVTKSFVGRMSRNEEMNIAEYISYYAGNGFITLDEYLQSPPTPSDILGKESFYSLNQFLSKSGLVDYPLYIKHLEFRSIGGGYWSNTYTFLRSYHYDFGWLGVFVLHSVSILLMTCFYEYVKKKKGNLAIIVFSHMYFSIALSFFAERFFSGVCSVSHIKTIVISVILYELLIRKKIKFVFKKSGYLHPAKLMNATENEL